MLRSSLIMITLVLSACVAPRQELPVYSRDVAQVGDFVVKEDFLRFRLKLEMTKYPVDYFQTPEGTAELKVLLKQLLDQEITTNSILAYGKKKSISLGPAEIEKGIEEKKKQWNPKTFESFLTDHNIPYSYWRQIVENEVKVQLIMDAELNTDLKISLGEMRAYYDQHDAEFSSPERVRVRHIVTDSLEKANDIYKRLLDGENFAKLAINHSLSPDRSQGGDLGYFARGSHPVEFDEACFKLNKGELSPIVKSDYGFHFFKLLDRKPAGKKSFNEVLAVIEQKLFEEKLKKKYDAWITKIKSEVSVTLHQDVLESFIL